METAAPRTFTGIEGMPPEWEHPDDVRGFWTRDRMHWPDPITVGEGSFYRSFISGFTATAEHFDMPVRPHVRRFYAHYYMAIAPLMLPEEELHALGQRSEQKLGAVLGRLEEFWRNELLPEVQENLAYWE